MTLRDPRADWRENAACAKHPMEWWFAEGTGREAQIQRATALRICQTCPSRQACADWALEHPESSRFGIWGGMSGRRRVQLMGRPTRPDEYHTTAVTCACGTVFYCAPSRPMKHCSGACLDAARARASKAAQQRMRDEKNPPDEYRLRNREAARRSRARARERAAVEAGYLPTSTDRPRVFPLVSPSPRQSSLGIPTEETQ